MASQQAPLFPNVASRSNLYSRQSQRYRGALFLSKRPKPEVHVQKDTMSACIDLTAYGEINDDAQELLVSPVSEDKGQVRSLSNCENEAAVAVEKIKNLLEHSQTEQIISGSMNRSRFAEIPKSDVKMEHPVETSTGESLPFPSKVEDQEQPPPSEMDDREELWVPGPSLPFEEDQSISVYEMTKARLTKARRNRTARRFQSTDMEQLTRKHQELVQKSSEYNSNSSALLEIIHIENDQVVPSPKQSVFGHRLVDVSGKDLLSSMVYSFDKNVNGHPTDIIVIDDILLEKGTSEPSASRSVKSGNFRYDAIKETRSGKLTFEKTNVHPLSPFIPVINAVSRREPHDPTLKSLNSIRDQVKALQQPNEDEPNEQKPNKTLSHDKSDNEEIDSLIVCASSHSLTRKSSADSADFPIATEKSATEGDPNPTTNHRMEPLESVHAERLVITKSKDRKSQKNGDETVVLNDKAIDTHAVSTPTEPILNSGYQEHASNLGEKEKILESVRSRSADISGTKEPIANAENNALELEISKIIRHDPLSTGITASDLCIGFCSKKKDDSVSFREPSKAISSLDHRENETNSQSFEHENFDDKVSTCTDQASVDSTNRTHDDTSVLNGHFAESNGNDQDSESRYNRDLAISAEESSSSYPSDVEIDDEANPTEEFQRDATIALHSMTGDSNALASKTSKVKIVHPVKSTLKNAADASTSDNGSTITDISETRVSLGDSENTDSDLDDEAGLYDTCFARQLLDATCGWLDKDDIQFCIQPSLLKKVKRRDVGTRGHHYGRSPLLMRVPWSHNLSRTNIDSRRKFAEKVFSRSRRSTAREIFGKNDHHQRFARSRRNQNIFGSDGNAKDIPIKTNQSKTPFEVNDPSKDLVTNKIVESRNEQVHLHAGFVPEKHETVHKNSGIFEVKSADECKSCISSNVDRVLRARSLSPTTVSNNNFEKSTIAFSNIASDASMLDAKAARIAIEKHDENAADEVHIQRRNKNRREGLSKLRRHHPERLEYIEHVQEEAGLEANAVDRVDEDQRVVALELAEKLRRRAITLKRRREIRERRTELRCTDSELVLSSVGGPEIKV
jgi:hypothetical protein